MALAQGPTGHTRARMSSQPSPPWSAARLRLARSILVRVGEPVSLSLSLSRARARACVEVCAVGGVISRLVTRVGGCGGPHSAAGGLRLVRAVDSEVGARLHESGGGERGRDRGRGGVGHRAERARGGGGRRGARGFRLDGG